MVDTIHDRAVISTEVVVFSNVPISSSGEAKAGQGLAAQLRIVNDEVVAFVQGCSPQQWQGSSRDEGWPVAVAAMHIAFSLSLIHI